MPLNTPNSNKMFLVVLVLAIIQSFIPHPENITTFPEPVTATVAVERKIVYDVPLAVDLQEYIIAEATTANLDSDLVMAVIKTESEFKNVVNDSDYGLMQINEINHTRFDKEYGGFNPFNPYQNVKAGITLLSEYRDCLAAEGYEGNELELAMLSSYNRGMGGFETYGMAVSYVSKIKRNQEVLSNGKVEVES